MLDRLLTKFRSFDWGIVLAAMVLFCFGLAAIYSVELSHEAARFASLEKQLVSFAIAATVATGVALSNYVQLRNYARVLYLVGIVLLVAVLLIGTEVRGTKGWFDLGPLSFQPVEFMKVALVVTFARYFGEHARRRFGWKEIVTSGLLTLLPVGLVMLQPDLGSASILIGIWGFVLLFAGVRWVHFAVIGGAGACAALIFWLFLISEYQVNRIMVFLNPALDPLGTGYNIAQAKIAIGAGRLFGSGLGFGSQSQLKFLPESQTDFIFAVIAEELGFIGVALVLGAISLLVWRLLRLVRLSRDGFTGFLAVGILGALFVQMFINIGVNLAILPATGVALPLVSYGGSSLLITMIFLGIAQSVASRVRPADALKDPWYTIDNNAKIM